MHRSLRMSKYKQKRAKNARKSGQTICIRTIRTQPAVFASLLVLCDGADFMLAKGNQTDPTTHIHLHNGAVLLEEMGE